MARTNLKTKVPTIRTHEGAIASHITKEHQLRRSVMSCLLWENEFYEDGVEIATRIYNLALTLPASTVANLAIEVREAGHLRHVPLLLLVALCKIGSGSSIVADTIERVIQRADELAELTAVYWKINGKDAALSSQLKKGLARAFNKFDEYQLSKYDRDGDIKLRDVAFLTHVKPKDTKHAQLMAKLVNKSFIPETNKAGNTVIRKMLGKMLGKSLKPGLEIADTWETNLSGGADKAETFTRLLEEGKLGYLALLRNLRNMHEANVDRDLVLKAIKARKGAQNVFPFRYLSAARAAPAFEPALDEALIASIKELPAFPGKTILLVDVSGSMDYRLSGKSDLQRLDAAAALASIFPGEDVRVLTFSHQVVEVPRRMGIGGIEVIKASQPHGGTYLGTAVSAVNRLAHDRLIVITDEQATAERIPLPVAGKAYMINVASAKNGVGYKNGWTHIDGFSENVIRYMAEVEGVKAEKPAVVEEAVKKAKKAPVKINKGSILRKAAPKKRVLMKKSNSVKKAPAKTKRKRG